MNSCFAACENLKSVPDIPESVISLYSAFYNCTNLKTIGLISENISTIDFCFVNCINLEEIKEINCNPTTFKDCLKNAATNIEGMLELRGYSSKLTDLYNTKSPESKIELAE